MARKALIVKRKKLAKKRQQYYDACKKAKEEGKPLPKRPKGRTRYYNRCAATGKTRAYMRKFGVSRQAFRKFAREGIIMGVKKSSW